MRVGAQLTEAMLLKNKASRKESAKAMKEMFELLAQKMEAAGCQGVKEDLEKFKTFELKHCELQSQYTTAYDAAQEAQALSEHLSLAVPKGAVKNIKQDLQQLAKAATASISYFVVRDEEDTHHVQLVRKDPSGYAIAQLDREGLHTVPVSKRYYDALASLL